MSQKYYAIVTDIGLAKLRAAVEGIGALTLSHMAFGDGAGQETAPGGAMTALVNERYRAPIADKKPHETNPSMLWIEAIIPPGVGGWTLREAGIYDTDGDLIVVAKTPVMDVALLSEGATTEGLVRICFTFESAQSVQFMIDPTVLLATQAWVIERILHRAFVVVDSITEAAPPAKPVEHALYVIPPGATGAWAGKDNLMAYWYGKWFYMDAPLSKIVGTCDGGKYYRRVEDGWEEWLDIDKLPKVTPPSLKLYVNSTSGHDDNDGLTAATAYRTIRRAFDECLKYYGGANEIVIQLAPGTYAAAKLQYANNVRMRIAGNRSSPQQYVIQGAKDTPSLEFADGSTVAVEGVELTGPYNCITIIRAYVRIGYVYLSGGFYHIFAGSVAAVTIDGPIWITKSATACFVSIGQSTLAVRAHITLDGSLHFSHAFAWAQNANLHTANMTYSGSCTGRRYLSEMLGFLYTGAQGPNFLPGSLPGDTFTGGVYN